jgi:hypothetical protein
MATAQANEALAKAGEKAMASTWLTQDDAGNNVRPLRPRGRISQAAGYHNTDHIGSVISAHIVSCRRHHPRNVAYSPKSEIHRVDPESGSTLRPFSV